MGRVGGVLRMGVKFLVVSGLLKGLNWLVEAFCGLGVASYFSSYSLARETTLIMEVGV
jgi:hypothetical protein